MINIYIQREMLKKSLSEDICEMCAYLPRSWRPLDEDRTGTRSLKEDRWRRVVLNIVEEN